MASANAQGGGKGQRPLKGGSVAGGNESSEGGGSGVENHTIKLID